MMIYIKENPPPRFCSRAAWKGSGTMICSIKTLGISGIYGSLVSAESYVSYKKPMAWILTVTKNLCLKKLKERAKDTYVTENELEMYPDERSVVTAEDNIIISECLNTLSNSERQIIILHAVAGMKHREIARITELPVSTVLSKYSRALKKLKKIL